MEDKKTKLIINDYLTRFESYPLKDTYAKIYESLLDDQDIIRLFAILHQNINDLLGFMNDKSTVNLHYNANESRELRNIIDLIDELRQYLKQTKYNFYIHEQYQSKLDQVTKFLQRSGGSTIPEDYEKIGLIKYDPIFFFIVRSISVSDHSENVDLKLIGEGAFAIVHKFTDPFYQKNFAKKTLKVGVSENEKKRFVKEYRIMKSMDFPYILEVYKLLDNDTSYIMDYCEETLEGYISQNNTKLTFEIRKKIALQFLYALNYIHSKDLLHRDISFKNILVKKYDKGAVMLKLSDFGLVKDLSSTYTKSESEYKGTIIDPTIDPTEDKFKDYNIKHEMYPIGVIILYIFTGRRSLENSKVPKEIVSIITKCTTNRMSDRYNRVIDIISDVENLII